MPGTASPSDLTRAWHYDASNCSFVTDGALIRVRAMPSGEADEVHGAKQQAEMLYAELFKRIGRPVELAKNAVARGFEPVPEDASKAVLLGRTVLVYYDTKPDEPSDRLAAYTRVTFDSERFLASAIAPTSELQGDAVQQVLQATVLATEELIHAMADQAFDSRPKHPVMVWRGQIGASDYLKDLFVRGGYSSKLTERLEMTAWLQELGSADAVIESSGVEGVEIRPLDLASDDLVAVFDTLKLAFGSSPPSFAAWKRHYPQQPRFAAELSFVAWARDTPVAVSLIELVVDGEGGGDDEVGKVYSTDAELDNEAKQAALTQSVDFADDYEDRQRAIREKATRGYVCGIATLPEWRGKRLGKTLLRHNFQAAARAGLDSVYLGTDRHNTPAVRAYSRAGMAETKNVDLGYVTAKLLFENP